MRRATNGVRHNMAYQLTFQPDVWVDRHGDAMYRYALLRLRDRGLAEEMVQEALLAALEAADRFAGQSSERTWLIGILKHKIMDHFRRVSRERPATDLETAPNDASQLFEGPGYWVHDIAPAAWGTDPLKDYERLEFRNILQHCLGELPARAASAFSLREVDGLDSGEICEILAVSSANLWVLLHRARAHLRLCLERNWFGGKVARHS